ncbi:MAG: energy-coupling factor ABC transporter ATP-binding protein, partial [Turicibacter sp.]|nr:energy-coupling factor ABC transporter ATP-binding protein [Turicibacter sp.]
EPTAGLDPQGQHEMMEMFNTLHKQYHKTIILVTHDMNLVAEYAEEMIVMHRGEMKFKGVPQQVFKEVDALRECGITLPIAAQNYHELANRIGLSVDNLPLTTDEFVKQIELLVGRN